MVTTSKRYMQTKKVGILAATNQGVVLSEIVTIIIQKKISPLSILVFVTSVLARQ